MPLSTDYYQKVFRNDPDKISAFVKLLLQDLKAAESDFFSAANSRNIKLMRRSLHTIYPFVSNLRFAEMLYIMDQYKNFDEYSSELDPLNNKLRLCFKSVYDFFSKES